MDVNVVAATAHPNIALIKYWGKRDERLHLPMNSSLSMTLGIYPTTTTIELTDDLATDVVVLDGAPAPADFAAGVSRFLDVARDIAGDHRRAVVTTVNTVATAAGLASSAAGFAALAKAADRAYRLDLDTRALSRLARRGSGSASRSIFGGFALWHRGSGVGSEGDLSSYAEQVDAALLDPAMVVAVVDVRAKAVASRAAMRHTVATSPFYDPWVHAAEADLAVMQTAIAAGDLAAVGEIAERNALRMHATMLAAEPAVRYLSANSIRVLDRVLELRAAGIAAYATADAGPNVKVLCDRRDSSAVAAALGDLGMGIAVAVALPGPPAEFVEAHEATARHGSPSR